MIFKNDTRNNYWKNLGSQKIHGGPLIINLQKNYITWVFVEYIPFFLASLVWVKQLGALHPKISTIFRMIWKVVVVDVFFW